MPQGTRTVPKMNLPQDLAEFLTVGARLEYDPTLTDLGQVTLLSPSELKLERYPMETSGEPFFKDDPHYPKVNSYLVLAVNLVKTCEEYDPRGILLWLPIERRFAAWDSSHCKILMFGEQVTWQDIVSNPLPYLEGSLGFGAPYEVLIPWLAHPYGADQVYEPKTL